MSVRTLSRIGLASAAAAEAGFALERWQRRRASFVAASQRAHALDRPLVVIGDPNAGAHTRLMPAYGCGDLCVDLRGCSRCTYHRAADLTQGPIEGIADDSAVVFISCVLEYVDDLAAARRESLRIAGEPANLFVVTVQPWTFTAALYPGARWAGATPDTMVPVGLGAKVSASAVLAALLVGSLLPRRVAP